MIKVLGIKLDNLKKGEILMKIKKYLKGDKSIFITTPNPEIILASQKDEEFFYILNQADLSLPDGFGLKLSTLLLGKKIRRQTGSDLTIEILELAEKNKMRVTFIVWNKGISTKEDISKSLLKKFPNLDFLILETDREGNNLNWQKINNFSPKIMLVALGAPWQEKLIYLKKHKISNLKISVGIGGALDFISGKIKRAPKLMRRLGLEWLWRLYQQYQEPLRWFRIFNAVFVFSYKVLIWKFIWPFKYRKNVACLLYRVAKGKYYFLLVERKDEVGHFQFVQGGCDGENIKIASLRELREELNLDKHALSYRQGFKDVYKYKNNDWPKSIFSRLLLACGYKGQSQSLSIVEFKGKSDKVRINYFDHKSYIWVEKSELINTVHPIRRKATEIFLKLFIDFRNKLD